MVQSSYMAEYVPTIGLEIHAELKTRTKMFCDSLNDPDEKHPNVNVCPVCLGHPGTLPTINKTAVRHVIRMGLALGGSIAATTKFDRKNYFYPDLPKGYQISQYDEPLVFGGELCGVRIRRIHLEEDAGNLSHVAQNVKRETLEVENQKNATSYKLQDSSFVDFNRAGVPLMELVTEPDIHDAETALRFARELQLTLRYLGASDANMEKGEMRIEVNISMSAGSEMGTKVEVKNINSFKAVEGAIAYEIQRQKDLLEKGESEKIVQETRGWDDVRRITVSQRSKENAHDYRYFPDPDLPIFSTAEFDPAQLAQELPELPRQKRERFAREFGLDERSTELLVGDPKLSEFFEDAVSELRAEKVDASPRTLLNYLTSDLRGLMSEENIAWSELKTTPEHLAHLASLVDGATITSRQAKDMLVKMASTGADPEELVKDAQFAAVSDDEIRLAVKKVIAENPIAVADYKKGKLPSLQFLIGQSMKALSGKAKPDSLREIILREIE